MKKLLALVLVSGMLQLAAQEKPLSQQVAATVMNIWKDTLPIGGLTKWSYDMGVVLKGFEGICIRDIIKNQFIALHYIAAGVGSGFSCKHFFVGLVAAAKYPAVRAQGAAGGIPATGRCIQAYTTRLSFSHSSMAVQLQIAAYKKNKHLDRLRAPAVVPVKEIRF